jgi:RNase P/RNase MRP subunit POP5
MDKKNIKKKISTKKTFTPFIQIQEEKLKTLMPTLRVKKRFILLKFTSEKYTSFDDINAKLSEEILYFMGAIDYSQSGFWMLKDTFNSKSREVVIKTSVKLKDKVICALSLIQDIDLEIKRVSGTLKGCNIKKSISNKK